MWLRRAVYGAMAGIAAYVVGFVYVTFGTMYGHHSWFRAQTAGNIEFYHVGHWLFYDAHFVGVSIEEGRFFTETFSILAIDPPRIPGFMYHAAPVILLLSAGAVVVYMGQAVTDSPVSAALAGSMVTLGYLGPTVIVALLLGIDYGVPWTGQQATMGVDLGEAIVYMGLVYPIVLGAAGGVLAHLGIQSVDGG